MCPFLLHLKHFLISFSFFFVPTFFGYVAVLVAIEALWLPILEIVIGLSDVH